MNHLRTLFLASTAASFIGSAAQADVQVVASIKPVHSLVAGVMDGVGAASLLVDGGGSPHTFSLRPSMARTLEEADIIFWVGPQLEAFLDKPISNLGRQAVAVRLDSVPDLIKLPIREGATFEAHDHGTHGDHDDHDDHAKHEDQDDHAKHDDHDDHAKHDDHAETHHDSGHMDAAFDSHLWLDPHNAAIFVRTISDTLSQADPENAAVYASNAALLLTRLDELETEINETLTPVKGNPFIVFHDAYQNFENRFGVPATGSITLSPEIPPGAERIREIRDRVKTLDVTCVFSEPQFRPDLISTVTENTNAKAGVLDPLGASIDNGPDLYFELMREVAGAMRDCLTKGS